MSALRAIGMVLFYLTLPVWALFFFGFGIIWPLMWLYEALFVYRHPSPHHAHLRRARARARAQRQRGERPLDSQEAKS